MAELKSFTDLRPYKKIESPDEGTFLLDNQQFASLEDVEGCRNPIKLLISQQKIQDYTLVIDCSKLDIPKLIPPILQSGEITLSFHQILGNDFSVATSDAIIWFEAL